MPPWLAERLCSSGTFFLGGGEVRGSKVRAEVCNCCHFDVLPLFIVAASGRLPATSLNCSVLRNSFTPDIQSTEGDVNAINLTE